MSTAANKKTSAKGKTHTKAVPANETKPQADGLGLIGMGNLSALLDGPQTIVKGGGPLELDMNLIDEDLEQPRTEDNPGFSDQSLDELAASISLRGVKTPISVRDNPDVSGRYLINHGARRFRATKRADKITIPGFIDNDYNKADQVVENLQRNELTAREIANYIGREIAKGRRKVEIAKAISKSPAFVTQHAVLLDLPDPIAKAFNFDRVRDVTLVNELMTAFKQMPEQVSAWLNNENQEITRGSVKLLREFLDDKRKPKSEDRASSATDAPTSKTDSEADEGEKGSGANQKKEPDPDKLKKAIVQVQHNNRHARLILTRRPSAEGFAWIKYEDDGQEFEASLSSATLVSLIEG